MPTTAFIIMTLIIIALATYAGWLLYRLSQQHSDRKVSAVQAAPSEHQLGPRESIAVLARALSQEQLSATEAAIRITALARALPESASEDESYRAFANLANATAHIPILEAWQVLDTARKNTLERERQAIEKTHHTQIMAAAKTLLTLQ